MPPSPSSPAQYQTVPLARISLQNDDFRITTCEDVDDLLASIQHAGLISPPLLIKQTSGYKIVSGFRRIAACRKLGWKEIIARILDPELNHLACLRMAIAENALQRPLNLIETSRAFQKLSSVSGNLKELAETASNSGLPTNYSIINKIKNLCLLPLPIQNSILKGTISLSMANELAMLEPDTAVDFARIFEQLKLSLNKQREIVTLVGEIARREDISIRQVLAFGTFQHILTDENLDRGQKGRKIRSFLRQRRFPRIVKTEQNYNAHLKKLKLGQDIKLIPPKEFEGTTYTLNLNFTSLAHLKTIQSMLDKIIQHPSFAKIVENKDSLSDKTD
jgi:ParB family chromosome partitioning protein